MGDKSETTKLASPEAVKEYAQDVARRVHGTAEAVTIYTIAATCLTPSDRTPVLNALCDDGFKEQYWQLREALRFAMREYSRFSLQITTSDDQELYNVLTANYTHFLHLSKDEPSYVAYTPDANYGKQDRRVKTTIGRYIKKFFPGHSDAMVRRLTETFKLHFGTEDILWAETAEDIVKVYTSGPHSCMAYPWADRGHYSSQVHPAVAYAAPGLRVAYLKRDGKINSRCLVYENPANPSDRRMIRVYGDELLSRKLTALGYTTGSLEGVRLAKIPALTSDGRTLYDTYVCPYIDDLSTDSRAVQGIRVENDALVVIHRNRVQSSSLVAGVTNGLVGLNRDYSRTENDTFRMFNPTTGEREPSLRDIRDRKACGCCGKAYLKDQGVLTRDNLEIGPCCANSVYVRATTNSNGTLQWVRAEEAVHLYEDGGWVLQSLLEDPSMEIAQLDPETYGERKYAYKYATHVIDGKVYLLSQTTTVHGGGRALIDKVRMTARKIRLPTASILPMDKLETLFVDPSNGWIRTVANSNYTSLPRWVAHMATSTPPEQRAAAVAQALRSETLAVQDLIVAWIPQILTGCGLDNLINEAAQDDLLCVEED